MWGERSEGRGGHVRKTLWLRASLQTVFGILVILLQIVNGLIDSSDSASWCREVGFPEAGCNSSFSLFQY